MNGHKKKQPTKKEKFNDFQKLLEETHRDALKDSFYRGSRMSYEIVCNHMLEKIATGCTMDELKKYLEMNLESLNLIIPEPKETYGE